MRRRKATARTIKVGLVGCVGRTSNHFCRKALNPFHGAVHC